MDICNYATNEPMRQHVDCPSPLYASAPIRLDSCPAPGTAAAAAAAHLSPLHHAMQLDSLNTHVLGSLTPQQLSSYRALASLAAAHPPPPHPDGFPRPRLECLPQLDCLPPIDCLRGFGPPHRDGLRPDVAAHLDCLPLLDTCRGPPRPPSFADPRVDMAAAALAALAGGHDRAAPAHPSALRPPPADPAAAAAAHRAPQMPALAAPSAFVSPAGAFTFATPLARRAESCGSCAGAGRAGGEGAARGGGAMEVERLLCSEGGGAES
jgi:hypothetical protein